MIVLVWIGACVWYIRALRRMLAARERLVDDDIQDVVAQVRRWEDAFAAMGERKWRIGAEAMVRTLDVLTGDIHLADRVQAARDVQQLVGGWQLSLQQEPQGVGIAVPELVHGTESALSQLEMHLADYNVAAADASFACERFPLSVLAGLAGLAPQLIVRETPAE